MPRQVHSQSRRKLVFFVLMVVMILGVVEIGSLVTLSILGSSLTRVHERRVRVSEEELSEPGFHMRSMPPGQPVELHPYFGFTSIAGESGLSEDTELARMGFPYNRRDRLYFEPSPERVVVGVFGGSVARIAAVGGAGLELVLNRVHRFAGKEIVVLSFADGGFKQPQQLMILNYLLALGVHFDLVINLDGFNEIALGAENQGRGLEPNYPRGWEGLAAVPTLQSQVAMGRLAQWKHRRRKLASRSSRFGLNKSPTSNLLWLVLDRRYETHIENEQNSFMATLKAGRGSELVSSSPRREGDLQEVVNTWKRTSKIMADLCAMRSIEYHHFLQPNQYFPGTKPLAAEVSEGHYLEDHPYAEAARRGYELLLGAGADLAAEGVNFHDLSRIFETHREAVYNDSCCHLDFVGNLRLEEAMAETLTQKSQSPVENVTDGRLALTGFDPVSYFDDQPTLGKEEWSANVDGIVYWHQNEANRRRFLSEPGKYTPKFGGWCAFGLGMDEKAIGYPRGRYPVEPQHYLVRDNKLYLFFRSPTFDAREAALKDWENVVVAAGETWNRR